MFELDEVSVPDLANNTFNRMELIGNLGIGVTAAEARLVSRHRNFGLIKSKSPAWKLRGFVPIRDTQISNGR